ncbi:MAG: Ig-like domain-containing protein [Desulfotignum sp.]
MTVNNVNRAPTIDYYSPSFNPTINEGESQYFNISATDLDGDSLTINWYLDGSLEQTGGNYTYYADYESNGSYTVKVNVTDGESVDEYSWTLTVDDVNRAPTLNDYYPTSDPTIDETESQYFNISVTSIPSG